MEIAEQGGAEPRAGKALGGALCGGADAVAAEADKAKPGGKAGSILEDNSELIRESIQKSLKKRIRERIRNDIDYDIRVHLPQTLARANALQMAFDSC